MMKPDIEAIRQSPRQFVDLETVIALSDYAMALEDLVHSQQGADEACKEVEQALEGLTYKGTYAQQIKQMRLDMVTLQALVGGSDDISQALIDEREALAAQNQQMREALDRWKEANLEGEISTLNHAYDLREKALALPNIADDILRKRDAETLRKAADWFESAPVDYAFRARTVLLSMIKELESGK